MKRIVLQVLCFVLAITMMLSLFGCSANTQDVSSKNDSVENQSSEPSVDDNTESDENTTESEEDNTESDDSWDDFPFQDDEDFSDSSVYIDELKVLNASEPAQKNFLGLNGVYHCYTYMDLTDGRTYTEKQAAHEIDLIKKMGVKMVRSYYGTKYAYDVVTGDFNWESSDMKAIYRWLKELQEADIEVALNAGWAIAQFLSEHEDGRGVWDFYNGVFVAGDPEQSAKNYGKWMVDTLTQFKAHGCNNVTNLLLFTEPGGFHGVRWGANEPYDGRWDGMSVTEIEDPHWPAYLRLTKALDKALKDAGIRNDYQLVGPNEAHTYESDIDGTRYLPMFYNALTEGNDYLDVFSHHNYISIPDMTSDVVADNVQIFWKERAELTKELTGKPFWLDETNIRDSSAMDDTGGIRMDNPWEAMQIATMVAECAEIGVQNIILWSLASQNWNNNTTNSDAFINGVQRTGVIPSPYLSFKPYVSYYGVSLLSKYFGHGEIYIIEDSLVRGVCEKGKDGEWTILLINVDFEETTVLLDFEKKIGKQVFYRYLYDTAKQTTSTKAELISADLGIRTNDGHFYDKLPGASFAVYTTREPE